ncbi:MAG TPA: methyltransferase [Pedobacter sp.]|jgi:tRNA1Val (adenine37-N6)-methyltransferase
MKVNTDGVLLGALLPNVEPRSILDIGTGTGVIALMLAQRNQGAQIDAVEIDDDAAKTANSNFKESIYSDRLKLYRSSFEKFSCNFPHQKYDLIVSNPPFFTNALQNPDRKKLIARHASNSLFNDLTTFVQQHLTVSGQAYFILPNDAAKEIIKQADVKGLYLQHEICIHSSRSKPHHRTIIGLGFKNTHTIEEPFVIYEAEKVYSEQYRKALKDFLTIF